mmetsp:Transcript_23618/g.67680  ORF Transcript_23618/g.67680 Transcript_23618/m.67680 type:complete len:390 (+) Transcript_23618:311-1480(+)
MHTPPAVDHVVGVGTAALAPDGIERRRLQLQPEARRLSPAQVDQLGPDVLRLRLVLPAEGHYLKHGEGVPHGALEIGARPLSTTPGPPTALAAAARLPAAAATRRPATLRLALLLLLLLLVLVPVPLLCQHRRAHNGEPRLLHLPPALLFAGILFPLAAPPLRRRLRHLFRRRAPPPRLCLPLRLLLRAREGRLPHTLMLSRLSHVVQGRHFLQHRGQDQRVLSQLINHRAGQLGRVARPKFEVAGEQLLHHVVKLGVYHVHHVRKDVVEGDQRVAPEPLPPALPRPLIVKGVPLRLAHQEHLAALREHLVPAPHLRETNRSRPGGALMWECQSVSFGDLLGRRVRDGPVGRLLLTQGLPQRGQRESTQGLKPHSVVVVRLGLGEVVEL